MAFYKSKFICYIIYINLFFCGSVNSAYIYNKSIVNKNPQIVIAIEFKYFATIINKLALYFCSKMIVFVCGAIIAKTTLINWEEIFILIFINSASNMIKNKFVSNGSINARYITVPLRKSILIGNHMPRCTSKNRFLFKV